MKPSMKIKPLTYPTVNIKALILIFFALVIISYPGSYACAAWQEPESISEMSIEDLMNLPIRSVGFFDMSRSVAPGSIWILKEEDIRNSPALNLTDLLQLTMPGVSVSGHSIYGSLYASRGVPMFDNSTSQFMLDGMNLNSGGSLGINSGLKIPLLGDLYSIETGNGPCAIIHGNGSINGFINLVPKTGTTNPGAYSNIRYGLDDGMKTVEAGYGLTYGPDRDFFIYAGIAGSEGSEPENDLGFSTYNSDDDGSPLAIPDGMNMGGISWPNYKSTLNWRHGPFQLLGFLQKELNSSNSFYKSAIKSPELYHQTLAIRPKLDIPLGSCETMELETPLQFFDSGYITGFKKPAQKGSSDARIEGNLLVKSTRIKNNRIAAGIKAEYDHHRSNRYYLGSAPSSYIMGDDADWMIYSLFTEDIITLSRDLTLTAGIRYDTIRYDTDDSSDFLNGIIEDSDIFSPRIAVSYNMTPATVLKAGYQEGFHFPPVTEIYTGNMKPESIKSFEINLLQDIPGTGFKLTLNTFYNIFHDAILADLGSSRGNQRHDFGSAGGEFVVDWTDGDNTNARLSYSYSRPLDISSQNVEIYTADEELEEWLCYPAHMVKGLIYRHWMNKKIMTSFAMEYGSGVSRPTEDYYQARDLFHNDRFSASFLGRLSIMDHLSMELIIKNLAHNNIPVPTYVYNSPWEGSLGDTETYFYIGFRWE